MSATTDRRAVGLPARGVPAGVAAALAGYLVAYVWLAPTAERRLRGVNFLAGLFGADPVPAWKYVAWLYFDAHFVALRVPSLGGRVSRHLLDGADWPLVALYLLPPAVLLLAGAVLGARERSPAEGALAGAAVAGGYAVLAAAGAAVTAYPVGDAAVGPDLATAVLLAGVAYPLVFGAAGGWLAARVT